MRLPGRKNAVNLCAERDGVERDVFDDFGEQDYVKCIVQEGLQFARLLQVRALQESDIQRRSSIAHTVHLEGTRRVDSGDVETRKSPQHRLMLPVGANVEHLPAAPGRGLAELVERDDKTLAVLRQVEPSGAAMRVENFHQRIV